MNDRDAFRDLAQRYARGADERDVDALTALFHPDAVINGTRGRQTRDEWVDTMRGPSPFKASMHLLGEPLADHAEGDNEARLDTYAVVYMTGDPDAGTNDMTLGMRYVDQVVRNDGRWVILHRDVTTVWMR